MVGDDDPVALVDRPEFAALSAGSRRERVLAAAALNTAINQRTTTAVQGVAGGRGRRAGPGTRLQGLRESQRRDDPRWPWRWWPAAR